VAADDPERRGARWVAAARSLNRDRRLLGTTRRVRERLLGDDAFVDRLSTARGRPVDHAARELTALRGDTPGVVGELGLTALLAWQTLAEHRGRGRGEVDVAILFTDLVGFSSWSLEAGDEAAIALLRELSEAVEPPVASHRGEVVKRLGDGLMAAFWDAAGATQAAIEACSRVAAIEAPGYRPRLRTGIHLGRPRKIGGDYFGVDVNIAARLAEAAGADEVLLSDRALAALGPVDLRTSPRVIAAKGAPADLVAHVLRVAIEEEAAR
jgi:adenylate cyclase